MTLDSVRLHTSVYEGMPSRSTRKLPICKLASRLLLGVNTDNDPIICCTGQQTQPAETNERLLDDIRNESPWFLSLTRPPLAPRSALCAPGYSYPWTLEPIACSSPGKRFIVHAFPCSRCPQAMPESAAFSLFVVCVFVQDQAHLLSSPTWVASGEEPLTSVKRCRRG